MDDETSLRQRRRAELTDQILAAALRQLQEVGPASLALRAVARDVGIAVSALYRYYANRDDLLTELLVRAFDGQADAVQAAMTSHPGDPVTSARAGLLAYRTWSVEHPAEFGLAFGYPVPGYHAPAERTVAAGARSGDLVVGAVTRLRDEDLLDPLPAADRGRRLTRARRAEILDLSERRGYALSAGLLSLAQDLFVPVHGFVVMEVFGQLRPLSSDPARWYADLVDRELRALGVR